MSTKKQLSTRQTTLIAFVVGLLVIIAGAGVTYFSYTFTRTAITTIGTVTHVRESQSRRSSGTIYDTYTPTISFLDEQGAAQSAQTPVSNQDYNFPLGTEISILYNQHNPNQIKLNKWLELWGFGAILLTAGFGIIAYTIFAWRDGKKPSASQKGKGSSVEDLNKAVASLRMMGRDAEADEIVKEMQSNEFGGRDPD